MHRKPFSKNSQTRADKPGECIHIPLDLCGKMPQTSLGGANYFIDFKDDCTSYRFVYFVKNKSDVPEIFFEFEKLVERQTGNKIRILRSDNGTEYINSRMSNYIKNKGIIHETSSPYTAEQNGKTERDIRSIVESARTILLESKLPESLWAEAVNTAVYTLNRRPCKTKNDEIPYEKWLDKKVSLIHMKRFESECYTYIAKQFRSKFQSKSKKMIMVDYDGYSSNYRLYDPITKKVTIARHVVFNESATDKLMESKVECLTYEWPTNTSDTEQPEIPNPPAMNLRNRQNIQPPDRCVACNAIIDDPRTYKEAISSKESEQWGKAMQQEISPLIKNNTWDLVPLPADRQPIDCKWVYRVKHKPNDSITSFKARLCAKGYSQKAGIDYGETFSPVVRYE